jgi:hypothetical protein
VSPNARQCQKSEYATLKPTQLKRDYTRLNGNCFIRWRDVGAVEYQLQFTNSRTMKMVQISLALYLWQL